MERGLKAIKTANKSEKDAPVYKVSEGVEAIYLETKGLEKEPDPHAWMNIKMVFYMLKM